MAWVFTTCKGTLTSGASTVMPPTRQRAWSTPWLKIAGRIRLMCTWLEGAIGHAARTGLVRLPAAERYPSRRQVRTVMGFEWLWLATSTSEAPVGAYAHRGAEKGQVPVIRLASSSSSRG